MMITGKNYIGNDLTATGDSTYATFNPKENTQTDWKLFEATEDEINKAAQKAKDAFAVYKDLSGAKKAEFLIAIAEEIEALGDELIETYMIESGLPEGRARGERGLLGGPGFVSRLRRLLVPALCSATAHD